MGEGLRGAVLVSDDAYDKVTGAFADASERAVQYANVWKSAIERNAAGTYKSEDLLVDVEALWGMSVRDAAALGAKVVESLASFVPDEADEGAPGEG
jgi:hypothetical protein